MDRESGGSLSASEHSGDQGRFLNGSGLDATESQHSPSRSHSKKVGFPTLFIRLSQWTHLKYCGRALLLIICVAIFMLLSDHSSISEAATWKYNSLMVSYSCVGLQQPSQGQRGKHRLGSNNASVAGREAELDARERLVESRERALEDPERKDKADLLLRAWERTHARLLPNPEADTLEDGLSDPSSAVPAYVPAPPHLQDCDALEEYHIKMDSRMRNGKRPVWPVWGGALGLSLNRTATEPRRSIDRGEKLLGNSSGTVMGPFPPWVAGADEDNLALTRRVQRDIWLHQHPRDCGSRDDLRFLLVDFDRNKRLGTGSQLEFAAGALATAISNNLVLVLRNLDRADHDGCADEHRGRLSCYFLPETSEVCQARAAELAARGSDVANSVEGKRIFWKSDFPRGVWWFPPVPRLWGDPWEEMHPTSEVAGVLVLRTKLGDVRWWRAQALRYLLRFPSARTCRLLNSARHHSFGASAAALVARTLPPDWPQAGEGEKPEEGELESLVWALQAPWVPRPLLSLHVRQGDKASEMKMVSFSEYMRLAERVRRRFPEIRHVWLSTEMQPVVEESASYLGWDFHYTDVPRQQLGQSMRDYETSMGRQKSSDNAIVNLLMAVDSDFFVGALGSTWCYVIDVLRLTGGKARQGYLSVNKDRFW